jgi:hypothetical protein
MNSLSAWGPTIVAAVIAIFTYGRFSMKQDAHEKRLDGHDDKFDDHGKHLQRVDIALVKLEEYNRGLADGIHMAKHAGKQTT